MDTGILLLLLLVCTGILLVVLVLLLLLKANYIAHVCNTVFRPCQQQGKRTVVAKPCLSFCQHAQHQYVRTSGAFLLPHLH